MVKKHKKQAQENKHQVVGYIRVSSSGQVQDGESLERQEAQIKTYCKLKNFPEPYIIADEGLSGFKKNRKGFQELINLCQKKQAQVVIVYDLSRLSRSVRDTLEFIEDIIQRNGIEFVSLQNDINTQTATGKAFLAISAVFNQLYRDEIAFKTKEALRHKASKGEKTGGTIPFGYCLVDGFKLQPLQGEIEVVKYIHGLRKQGLSLRTIIQKLQLLGVKTKTGLTAWNPKVVRDILSRQVDLICNSCNHTNRAKDEALHDVTGALYDIEAMSFNQQRAVC